MGDLELLPWQVNFLQFDYRVEKNPGGDQDAAECLPPDHAWFAP